ncbi:UDP-N-acetylglucosamine transferase subunit ALG14 homolog [Ischnura elegans]|uniref:UDP-N-acetylglucosamine transferase subunit ALG14 homolog n=1 Tax=Ischnura elegans TaxID=197161 RepID=UPI001ED88D6A|nr:UDP-N-acetylglucosamine transferase subunit ALG14 homolog [Ischnura elegans]
MTYVTIGIFLLAGLVARIVYLLCLVRYRKTQLVARPQSRLKPAKTAIVMGSGGHTAEMLRLVGTLNFSNYNPRLYIMASTDKGSEAKVINLENEGNLKRESERYIIHRIPRSRHVNQSYISSVFSTLYSLLYSVPFLLREKPELILCNGPGTCVPICAIAFFMKILWICDCKIVFVESICRVKTLSLTGKILLHFADEFFVQWKDLHDLYRSTKYIGCLV